MKPSIRFLCLLFALGAESLLLARAPEDQILLPPPKERSMRILRNKNITYTNEQPDEKGAAALVRTEYAVKGRSRPDRAGKVLSQIAASSPVTPFKWSRDKKWVAVIVKNSGVRVWIPKSALPKLTNDFKPSNKADAAPKVSPAAKDDE